MVTVIIEKPGFTFTGKYEESNPDFSKHLKEKIKDCLNGDVNYLELEGEPYVLIPKKYLESCIVEIKSDV